MSGCCVGEDFSEELMCALCLDSWKEPVEMVPCGHIFCKECASILKSCPVCRGSIEGQRTPNRTLVNLALSVRVKCRTCGWKGTREESLHHKCGAPSYSDIFDQASKPQSAVSGHSAPDPTAAPFGVPNYPSSNTFAAWQQQPSPQQQPQGSYGGMGYPQQQQQMGYFERPQQPPMAPPRRRYQTIEPSGSRPWMLYGIDQQEYDQIVSLFVFFDDDDSGQLDKNEVSRLARWLNFARTPQEVDAIFADMDSDGSGSLSLGEFLTWLKYNKPNPEALYGLTQSQYNTIMMQFHTYDSNQDGLLEEPEFCRLVLGLGDARDTAGAQRLFRMIDTNGDHSIDLHEFLRFRAGRR